jgi:hypothetical protein
LIGKNQTLDLHKLIDAIVRDLPPQIGNDPESSRRSLQSVVSRLPGVDHRVDPRTADEAVISASPEENVDAWPTSQGVIHGCAGVSHDECGRKVGHGYFFQMQWNVADLRPQS